MAPFRRLLLLALPLSLLSAAGARADQDKPSSAPGITRDDQREERFYNFDQGRQSGGGFTDPSDLIRKLQNARNLQHATDPAKTVDAALEDFSWPDEAPPEEEQQPGEEELPASEETESEAEEGEEEEEETEEEEEEEEEPTGEQDEDAHTRPSPL